jgi:hypothetical protein
MNQQPPQSQEKLVLQLAYQHTIRTVSQEIGRNIPQVKFTTTESPVKPTARDLGDVQIAINLSYGGAK